MSAVPRARDVPLFDRVPVSMGAVLHADFTVAFPERVPIRRPSKRYCRQSTRARLFRDRVA